jgi:hypothetical protein
LKKSHASWHFDLKRKIDNATSGVNFINILHTCFLYKSKLISFSLITLGFAIFWRQNIGEKVTHKMLMKLTPGVNFIKHFMQAFFE